MTASRGAPLALLVLASASWGLSNALTKIAVEQVPPVDLFGIEVLVGGLAVGGIALARGARLGRPDPRMLAIGVLEPGLVFLLFDVGVAHTAAAHASLLFSTDTLLTLLLAAILLRERLGRSLLVALGVGVIGTTLVTWDSSGASATLGGDLLIVASATGGAGYTIATRHVAAPGDPFAISAVQLLGGALVAAPVALSTHLAGGAGLGGIDAGHLAVALLVTLLTVVIPFALYNAAIRRVSASTTALVLVLIPVFGALASVGLVGESLGPGQLIGGALTIAAAAVAAVAAEPVAVA